MVLSTMAHAMPLARAGASPAPMICPRKIMNARVCILLVAAGLATARPALAGSVQAAAQAPAPEVLMFSLPDCTHCVSAKALLSRRHIPYQVIDLSTEAGAQKAKEMRVPAMAPVFVYRGKMLQGYTEAKLLTLVEE